MNSIHRSDGRLQESTEMTTIDAETKPTGKGWKIGLWAAQLALAAMFLMAGITKLISSPTDMVAMGMAWAENAPVGLIRFVSVAEVLGAIGVVLPAVTRIKPDLTKLAAAGLAAIMGLAFGLHAYRGEFGVLPVNLILFGLAVFVIWGRTNKAPIPPRGQPPRYLAPRRIVSGHIFLI